MKSLNEAKYGFWGALARKAKSLLDEDGSPGQHESPTGQQLPRDGGSVNVQVGICNPPAIMFGLTDHFGANLS
jgi:hypothetical protein